MRHAEAQKCTETLACRYDNFLFATMAFVRGVAEGGLAPSHPKCVLPREEWGAASLFLSQEIVSWLPTSNESSALFEMGKKTTITKNPGAKEMVSCLLVCI